MTSNRRTLLLLAALFSAPLLMAYVYYFVAKPTQGNNYGELLNPAVLPDAPLKSLDGAAFRLSALRGRWVLLSVDSGVCAGQCMNKLYTLRQATTIQGKNQHRIERVWLIDDALTPPGNALHAYAETVAVFAQGTQLLADLPAAVTPREHIYLVDPLGNLILRYPRDADPAKLAKDLRRLLLASQIG
ncbi:MAG: SCO family protein [Burkholderiales bacterium]